MLQRVFSLEEATEWFLSHASGSVICVKGDETCECLSFPDAREFYKK